MSVSFELRASCLNTQEDCSPDRIFSNGRPMLYHIKNISKRKGSETDKVQRMSELTERYKGSLGVMLLHTAAGSNTLLNTSLKIY